MFTSDRLKTRLNALAGTFTKTDRILTGNRQIAVRVSNTQATRVNAPGFSDGRNITINADTFKNIGSAVSLVRLLGLNYHELSHIMFTPRKGTKLRSMVEQEKLFRAFNLLEDQRIETLFSATYKPAGKYFTEMVVEFFVDKEETWTQAYIFVYGRKFLPLEIRDEFKKRFAGSREDRKRAEEIIDEYRLLDLSVLNQSNRESNVTGQALGLIREFSKIMNRAADAAGEQSPNPSGASEDGSQGCGAPTVGEPDRSASKSASRSAREQAEEQEELEEEGEDGSGFWDEFDDEEEDEDDDEEDAGGGSSSSSASDDDEDFTDDDGDGSDDEGGDMDDEEEGSDSDSNSSSGSDSGEDGDGEASGDSDESGSDEEGGGGGSAGSNPFDSDDDDSLDDSELRDVLKDVLNAVMDSEQVQGDIRRLSNSMNDPSALDLDGDVRTFPSHEENVTPALTATLRDVQREFRRLWAQVEPGWHYGADEGRLNVQRAMTSTDFEDVFDVWDEGKEQDSGLEVCIALDVSSSMAGEIDDASAALWILKRACDELDAVVSVVSFGATTKTVYQRGEKVSKSQVQMFPAREGNTCPAQSFRIARRILTETDKANKLFIILTDGVWSPSNVNEHGQAITEDIPALVKSIPGTTVFIGIGPQGQANRQSELFDISKGISHTNEIAPLVKHIITTMLRAKVGVR